MPLAQELGIQDPAGAVERIHRGIDPELGDRAGQHYRCVQVREGGRRSGVREVVGRHVDRLHRGDRALLGRGDALLEVAHLGRERRLIPDRAGHPAQQRRNLGAGLSEPENVVDEEQHVLAFDITEILRDGEAGESDSKPGAGRLVHLAVDEGAALDDPRLLHFEVEVVALAGPLTHAAEDRLAAVTLGHVVDQLHDDDGLPYSGAPEQADFSALYERRDQVDDLDAGLEDLGLGLEVGELGRFPMDGPPLVAGGNRGTAVHRLAQHVEDPSQRSITHWNRDRRTGVNDLGAPHHTIGARHGDGTHLILSDMLLHLGHDPDGPGAAVILEQQRVIDLRKVLRLEFHIEHRADDLDDLADVLCRGCSCHVCLSVR